MKWEAFNIKFTSPMKIGEKIYDSRQGLILSYHNAHAELSPFFELHGIGLENAKAEIDKLLPDINFEMSQIDMSKPLFNLVPNLNEQLLKISSCSLFCLESLALNLFESELLTHSLLPVKVNGLFIPGISSLSSNLPKVLKVKIGRQKVDIERRDMCELIKKGHILRPDGNRSFCVEKLSDLLKDVPNSGIDYLEEPLKDLSKWNEFYERCPNDLALDENLKGHLEGRISSDLKSVSTWVIKPSVHYAISGCISLINEAQKKNVSVVISSAFETSIGLKSLIYLANRQDKIAPTSHGLDTLKFLESDIGAMRFKIEDSKILPI